MRNHKYRIWNNEEKRMIYLNKENAYHDRSMKGDSYYQDMNIKLALLSSHCIVMEYTGLTDSNEIDIYEGDIVYEPSCGSSFLIKFENGGFMLWQNSCCLSEYVDSEGKCEVEVIGNKFQLKKNFIGILREEY